MVFSGLGTISSDSKNVNDSTYNMVKISDTADKTLTYVTKITDISTGAAGATKDIILYDKF